jgi:hypothetical protein
MNPIETAGVPPELIIFRQNYREPPLDDCKDSVGPGKLSVLKGNPMVFGCEATAKLGSSVGVIRALVKKLTVPENNSLSSKAGSLQGHFVSAVE